MELGRMTLGNPTSLPTAYAATNTTNYHTKSISATLLFANKTCKTQQQFTFASNPYSTASHFNRCSKNGSFLSFPQQSKHTHFGFHPFLAARRDVCMHALKKPRKGGTDLKDMNPIDKDEFDDWDDENEDYGDEEMSLSFGNMNNCYKNKPHGFGEGMVYDTSIEDKLLDEIEQSMKAQAANIGNLKNNTVNPGSKKVDQIEKAPQVIPRGISVRVFNLPKKKNIHRDLKSAFKRVPGMVNIIPAVSGNKKTRDPICKGFAFVEFKSEESASRFVELFSGQNVAFGKTQKQIKCQMTNSNSLNSSDVESGCSSFSARQLMVTMSKRDSNAVLDMDDSSFKETGSDGSDDPDVEIITSKLQDVAMENVESFGISQLNCGDSVEMKIKSATGAFSTKKPSKKCAPKKIIAKGVEKKSLKLDIPGSAKRLKIREKGVLSDVFTKYGLQTDLASREKR